MNKTIVSKETAPARKGTAPVFPTPHVGGRATSVPDLRNANVYEALRAEALRELKEDRRLARTRALRKLFRLA